jgi:hypothetical protein
MAPDRDEAVESRHVRKHEVEEYKVRLRMEPRRLTSLVDRACLSDHGLIQHRFNGAADRLTNQGMIVNNQDLGHL